MPSGGIKTLHYMKVNAACLVEGEDKGRGPATREGSPLGCFSS